MGRIRKEVEYKDEGRGRTESRNQARVFDGLAEELFESSEPVRKAFPGSHALHKALFIDRTNLVKNGRRRHLRRIAGLLRDEFTADQVKSYLEGGTIERADEAGPDLEAIRDSLCNPDTFEDALAAAQQLMPILDTQAARRYAQAVHESDDRRAYFALYKVLRQAADAMADDVGNAE